MIQKVKQMEEKILAGSEVRIYGTHLLCLAGERSRRGREIYGERRRRGAGLERGVHSSEVNRRKKTFSPN